MIGKYEEIGAEIGRLVDKKQKAYGRSFDNTGKILAIIYPLGIRPDQYDDLGAMIRIIDKFFRIAISKKAFGEDPWEDVAGYALLKNRDFAQPCIGGESPVTVSPDSKSFLAPFDDNHGGKRV
jgi:hypothetical protein